MLLFTSVFNLLIYFLLNSHKLTDQARGTWKLLNWSSCIELLQVIVNPTLPLGISTEYAKHNC